MPHDHYRPLICERKQPSAICWQINWGVRGGGIPAQRWHCARLRLWKQQADIKKMEKMAERQEINKT